MENLWNQWLVWKQWLSNAGWTQSWQWKALDVGLILVLAYAVLFIIRERRSLWMIRGFVLLMLLAGITRLLQLEYFSIVLSLILLIAAVAMAVELQIVLRQFLEQLGQFKILDLFQSEELPGAKSSSVIGEIVDAVKELSQNRTGAIMVLETASPLNERDFSVPGVRLNAELSKELLQTIFQTSTLLHDGAVWIRASRIVAAGVILPISEQPSTRRLGTRHRAAMGITERIKGCICVVVSEETGSISLADQGVLNRPITSNKLKELLEARFSAVVNRETVAPDLRNLGLQARRQLLSLSLRLLDLFSLSALREKK